MTPEVQVLFDLAHEDLAAARLNLEQGFIRVAISRAYYAAFHAAQAALLTVGEAPRTHAGVRTRFNKHFVTTGRIAVTVSAILAEGETMRNQADYDAFTVFDARAAADLIADVETFVQAVEAIIAPAQGEAE